MNKLELIATEIKKIEVLESLFELDPRMIDTDHFYSYLAGFPFMELDTETQPLGWELMKKWKPLIDKLSDYWATNGTTLDEQYCLDELWSVAMVERNMG